MAFVSSHVYSLQFLFDWPDYPGGNSNAEDYVQYPVSIVIQKPYITFLMHFFHTRAEKTVLEHAPVRLMGWDRIYTFPMSA